ncbi:MAG: hypothetical protein KGJ07_00110 [Patescibacteria group bacterium]|nr:hypothetical protein [Patescibacteria group bacterium]
MINTTINNQKIKMITGHDAEMNAIEEYENTKPTREEMAQYLISNIKTIIEDELKELFDSELTNEEKIDAIKRTITQYGF